MKSLITESTFVSVFRTHAEAEEAIKQLQSSGFNMKKLSIVARDYHTEEQVIGYYNAGDRIKYWGQQGAFWGGVWGMLFGSAFFWVPGVGPLVVAGPLTAWIVSVLEGAVVFGSLSAVGAGLCSIGITKDSVIEYETAIKAGKFVLIAHGTALETLQAQRIVQASHPELIMHHKEMPLIEESSHSPKDAENLKEQVMKH